MFSTHQGYPPRVLFTPATIFSHQRSVERSCSSKLVATQKGKSSVGAMSSANGMVFSGTICRKHPETMAFTSKSREVEAGTLESGMKAMAGMISM